MLTPDNTVMPPSEQNKTIVNATCTNSHIALLCRRETIQTTKLFVFTAPFLSNVNILGNNASPLIAIVRRRAVKKPLKQIEGFVGLSNFKGPGPN